MKTPEQVGETLEFLQKHWKNPPQLAMVLGSGLSELTSILKEPLVLPYAHIPHFPLSTVEGHQGNLVYGFMEGKPIVFLQGRFHYYEGYDLSECTFPLRVLGVSGVKAFILTNAAGGIREDFEPGDLVLIRDHINLLSANPLRGKNQSSWGPRFPDMTEPYCPALRALAREVFLELGLPVKEGVYLAGQGPSYETKAEILMMKTLGADLVGMSTVPETLVARHMSIPVLGISLVTNKAAGLSAHLLSHQEVIETSLKAKTTFLTLLKSLLPRVLASLS
jgi:purine-nucleoside phosphorylase